MHRLQTYLPWSRHGSGYGTGLDLGDGRTLPPEDVLDGHSVRLLARRQSNVRTVPIQLHDLSAAIMVMAPDLAPLADLAEEVAVAVPAVAPEAAFRRNLHEALERTHRQHRVEEALGTRPKRQHTSKHGTAFAAAVVLSLCVCSALGWLAVRRSRRARSHKRNFLG